MIGIWGASLSKKCVYCGAGMPEEAAICLHCFHKVTPHTAVSTKRLRKYAHRRRTGIALLFSCCLFLSVLSCVCVYLYPSVTTMHTGAASGAENTAAVQNEQTGKVGQFFQRLLEPVGDVDATRASNTVDSDAFDTSDGFSASDTSAQSGPIQSGGSTSPSAAPGTTAAGSVETGTTSPEAQVPQVPEYDSFEYTSYGGSDTRISMTKYTGNAASVVVPAQIDGKIVVEI